MNLDVAAGQVAALSTATSNFASLHGEDVVNAMEAESELMLSWLHFLNSQKTGVANELLEGAVSSVREATACSVMGMVRPAIFSIRMHVDLLFAWLYFKDHQVEWITLNRTGKGFLMKSDLLKYLEETVPGYGSRWGLLKTVMTRSVEDLYRLLSAHVHAQSTVVIPAGQNLADVVQERALVLECASLWRETSEYVSDVLVSVYALNWAALPANIQQSVEQRLAKKNNHREQFFGGV